MRNNPHNEIGSFEKKPSYRKFDPRSIRQVAPDHDKHIAERFFLYWEYAHPSAKNKNPYEKELFEFFNGFYDGGKETRAQTLFRLFKRYKSITADKVIKPEWIPNRPDNISIESFKDL
jgi:hypothetical protein